MMVQMKLKPQTTMEVLRKVSFTWDTYICQPRRDDMDLVKASMMMMMMMFRKWDWWTSKVTTNKDLYRATIVAQSGFPKSQLKT